MPYTVLERKAAMMKAGWWGKYEVIGAELGVDPTLVGHVVSGARHGPQSQRIKEYLADKLQVPVNDLFPEKPSRSVA